MNVTSIFYQVNNICGVIPIANGLFVYGELVPINPSFNNVLMQPQLTNQFLIEVGPYRDFASYSVRNQINAFNDAVRTYFESNRKDTLTFPRIDDFVTGGPSVNSYYVTGKIIRTTSGSGFALAATCYPDVFPDDNCIYVEAKPPKIRN